jgi:uncharacterized membrane protein YjgN (DUF898 family)
MHITTLNRARVRLPVAAFTVACGVVTALGGLLTWIAARGPRPSTGVGHTSFRRMLVYQFDNGVPYWKSVGFVLLILGLLMIVGALTGLRTLTVLAALLAIGTSGMWIGLVTHHYNTPNLPNSHYLNPANLPWSDLRAGAWLSILGAILGLLSAFLLRKRTQDEAT